MPYAPPQELMAVSRSELRLALLKKAFISDWDGAAPVAASDKKCGPVLYNRDEAPDLTLMTMLAPI